MDAWIKGLDVETVGMIAAPVILAGMLFWDQIKGGLGKLSLTTGGTPDRPRVAILNRLDEVYSFFEEEGCQEGMAAIKVAINHVYHDHP